ncbi:MAG: quinoprotein relay system zinc metallohydrolase 1, partial [Betaproteobacteria bacterium]|nr:quinoprotein relay system zinc metallohydrolase 1 [Betaproteobacteria bacterium]
VVDTGPSRRYGEALRAAIARVTSQPVVRVFITHQHPDHFLGAQAFPPASLEALPGTINAIARDGESLNENMYRLNGDWMAGTEVVAPQHAVAPGEFTLGEHRFRLLALNGHTGADLALFDASTGVLFAGDLAFHDRAPTTPQAQIKPWLAALDTLAALPLALVVPGHGPTTRDGTPLAQTRAYLLWLQATLTQAAAAGLDMSETLALPLPQEIRSLAVAQDEYRRSVGHLFPALEAATLEQQR